MYFLVYLQRLVGTRRLESLEMRIKNRVKSAGEFGETDTIIMDDYFFI